MDGARKALSAIYRVAQKKVRGKLCY